jgi:hypothetical protein
VSLLFYLTTVLDTDADTSYLCRFDKRAKILFYLGSLVNLLIAAIVITGTELTLRWNNVVGVYGLAGIGQVMTVILGLVAFFHVPWAAYMEYKKKSEGSLYENSSSGSSLSVEGDGWESGGGDEDLEIEDRGGGNRQPRPFPRSPPPGSKPKGVDVEHGFDVQHGLSPPGLASVGPRHPPFRKPEEVDVQHRMGICAVASTRRDPPNGGALWGRVMRVMARTAGT